MNIQLQPLQEYHIAPFLADEQADATFASSLFDAVKHFYQGRFAASEQLLQACNQERPNDVRVAFFEAMIPFLNHYFFEESPGPEYARFVSKLNAFPSRKAKSGDMLSMLLTSGVYGYASLGAIKNKNYFDAGRYGLEGWAYLRKLPETDATGLSAIGRGLMAFLAGSAPFPVRLTFTAQGVEASREKGLRYLEQAAASDSIVSADALLILSQLYPIVDEHRKARLCAALLCDTYPENAVFQKVRENLTA
jgi:hypothetical protein